MLEQLLAAAQAITLLGTSDVELYPVSRYVSDGDLFNSVCSKHLAHPCVQQFRKLKAMLPDEWRACLAAEIEACALAYVSVIGTVCSEAQSGSAAYRGMLVEDAVHACCGVELAPGGRCISASSDAAAPCLVPINAEPACDLHGSQYSFWDLASCGAISAEACV